MEPTQKSKSVIKRLATQQNIQPSEEDKQKAREIAAKLGSGLQLLPNVVEIIATAITETRAETWKAAKSAAAALEIKDFNWVVREPQSQYSGAESAAYNRAVADVITALEAAAGDEK
jgi:ABC-type tungstate transport system substrate-binding protein